MLILKPDPLWGEHCYVSSPGWKRVGGQLHGIPCPGKAFTLGSTRGAKTPRPTCLVVLKQVEETTIFCPLQVASLLLSALLLQLALGAKRDAKWRLFSPPGATDGNYKRAVTECPTLMLHLPSQGSCTRDWSIVSAISRARWKEWYWSPVQCHKATMPMTVFWEENKQLLFLPFASALQSRWPGICGLAQRHSPGWVSDLYSQANLLVWKELCICRNGPSSRFWYAKYLPMVTECFCWHLVCVCVPSMYIPIPIIEKK